MRAKGREAAADRGSPSGDALLHEESGLIKGPEMEVFSVFLIIVGAGWPTGIKIVLKNSQTNTVEDKTVK